MVAATAPLVALLVIGFAVLVAAGLVPSVSMVVLFTTLFLVPAKVMVDVPGRVVDWVIVSATVVVASGAVRRIVARGAPAPWSSAGVFAVLALGAATLLGWSGFGNFFTVAFPLVATLFIAWGAAADAQAHPQSLTRAVNVLLGVSVVLAGLAAVERVTGINPVQSLIPALDYGTFPGRSATIMSHPIVYGGFCMVMLVVALFDGQRRSWIFAAANVAGLVLSGARSAWLGAAIAVVVGYLVTRRKTSMRGILAVCAALLAAVVAVQALPDVARSVVETVVYRLTSSESLASAGARTVRIDAAWDSITESLATFVAGHGPGATTEFFTQYRVGDGLANVFDNSYLTLWNDFGLVATAAFVFLLLAAMVRPGAMAGRLVLLAVAVQACLFDVYAWPAALGGIALGVALRVQPRQAVAPPSRSGSADEARDAEPAMPAARVLEVTR